MKTGTQSLRSGRRGMTLVELVVAMTLLGIIISSLARVSVYASTFARTSELVEQRSAIMQQQIARLGGIPFSRLDSVATGNNTVVPGNPSFHLAIGVSSPTTTRRTITLKVWPASQPGKADSLSFDRAQPPIANPLCAGC